MSDILVFDSSWLLHRSRHTVGDILSHNDMKTGVMFGFFWSVFKFCQEYKTSKLIFCFDSKESKRKEFYPMYKSKRHLTEKTEFERLMDQAAYDQFNMIPKLLQGLGFRHLYRRRGFESDDLLASICMSNPSLQDRMIVLTNDNDLLQILPHCKGIVTAKGFINAEMFKEQYGIDAADWATVKAYGGCTTDSVPGIPGFGVSTAIKFIKSPPMKGVLSQRFFSAEGRKIIERNRKLTTLPYEGTPKIVISGKDTLCWDAFLDMCSMYALETFLSNNKNFEFWRNFFLKGGW